MTDHEFTPGEPLLAFHCFAQHKGKRARIWMALDTGATCVTISRKWLEALGYDLSATEQSISFGDASQSHTARVVLLDSFGLSGAEETKVECVAHTLPEAYGLDGIIDLNYLRRFRKVTLDFGDSVLTLDRGEPVVPCSA